MQITVGLPDGIARHADPGREALERLAIEGYRSGALTHHQASLADLEQPRAQRLPGK